jgi:hypothetical protein
MLASPAALALPGIAVDQIVRRMRTAKASREPSDQTVRRHKLVALSRITWKHVPIVLLALSLLLTAVLTYRDFLVVWPEHPRVRYAFQSSMTEALRYLNAQPDTTPVIVAGLSPHDMDPWTEQCTLQRRDLDVRWIDTRSALVLPPDESVRLVTLDITPIEPALAEWSALDAAAVLMKGDPAPRGGRESEPNAPTFVDPAFVVYDLDATALRRQALQGQAVHTAIFVGQDPFSSTLAGRAVQFGNLVRFEGYEWLTTPQLGRAAQLLTFWTALDSGPSTTVYGEPALKIFLHLLDQQGQNVAGIDLLGAAPDTWVAGDLIVQLHAFSFPQQAGKYAVELGWYVPLNGPRLPVDGVQAPEQRILLEPVEVRP